MPERQGTDPPAATVQLGAVQIGPGRRIFVVAEAGVNHNGQIATAKQMIEVAKKAGADAVKFQAFQADRLVTRSTAAPSYQSRGPGRQLSQYELLRRLELDREAFAELKAHCDQCEIAFLATPFGPQDVEMLAAIGPVAIKIASTDLTNSPLLEAAVRTRLPLVVSTGAAQPEEIDAAVEWLGAQEAAGRLVLLHCISSYPTRPEDANLRRIGTLAARYGVPTGFSDHTMGIETGAMAAAAGACLLEKHFTLSRAQHGPDHSFSLEPDGLAAYVRQVRLAEQVLGQGQLGMSPCEQEVRRLGRSSVVAAQDIAAGQRIGLGMLTVKRPGGGIEPSRLYELVGRTAVVDIPAEAQVRWEMVN